MHRVLLRPLVSILPAFAMACGGAPDNPPVTPTPTPVPAVQAIRLNQVGYLPAGSKLAMVVDSRATGLFTVRRTSDRGTVFTGMLGSAQMDSTTGDVVRRADFSSVSQTGSYVLDVSGLGESYSFDVATDVYRRAYSMAMRAFYGQRCGIRVDLAPTFPGYRHAACHGPGSPNPDAQFHTSSGRSGTIDAGRGWHDAGDYGKYVVNSGITTGQLLWTFERYANVVGGLSLDLPESANATPDILDEVRWNLEWMLTMQDTDGGVWHKLTSAGFGGFTLPEADNAGPRFVIGTGAAPYKSSCATADFAAVMAIAARLYGPYDDAFAARCLAAAQQAWLWTRAYPAVVFRNCCGVSTGEYGDNDCSDEVLWAAAELYRSTGEPAYDDHFLANYLAKTPTIAANWPQGWSDVRQMAMFSYYFSGRPTASAAARGRIRSDALAAADAIAARTTAEPYAVSLAPAEYVWGSNGVAANYGVVLLMAHAMEAKPAYVTAALDNLHYLLGRNTFGLSWVTQLGDNPFRYPHHRPSGADSLAEPWPGMLSGGPNRYGGDAVIDALPAQPPARRYKDDQDSYASNEIAINWNAPLVFLLAGANAQ